MTRTVPRAGLVSALASLGLIAVAAVGYAVSDSDRDYQLVVARVGEVHSFDAGTARVGDVRVGTSISRDGKVVATTPGLFVAVEVSLQAPGNTEVSVRDVQLVSQDATYDAMTIFDTVDAHPGFQTTRQVIFEVAPGRIDDLSFQAADTGLVSGYHQRLDVHLGITDANAARWVDAGRDQVIEADVDEHSEGLS